MNKPVKPTADPAKRAAYNEYHRRYRAEHRERIREISRKSHQKARAENPMRIVEKALRRESLVRAAGTITPKLRAAVYERHGSDCYLCGSTATAVDHYQPITAGGLTTVENLRPVCVSCNARKGSAWPFDENELRARIREEAEL